MRPVIERILFPILFTLKGDVQAYFMQLILPELILYWFSTRPCGIVNLFVLSEKDFEARQRLQRELPMLVAGIYMIKTRNGYQVRKFEFKN